MDHQPQKAFEVEPPSDSPQPTNPNAQFCSPNDGLPLINDQNGPDTGSSVSGAVFNLATSVIGAGIMALPASMRVLGLLFGLLAIFVIGALTEFSIELLVRFAVFCKSTTYGEVVKSTLGGPAKIVLEICVVINNAGVLIVYLIIIGDVMSGSPNHVGVFNQWLGDTVLDHRQLVMFLVLVFLLAPLCALEDIDSLVLTSALSIALAVVYLLVSCSTALVKIVNGTARKPRLGPDLGSRAAILDLLVVIPVMTNAYVCHFNVLPIYNELKGRSVQKMKRVGRITTILCVAVFASTALAGYLLFGDDTEADVLTNFDRDLGVRFSRELNYLVRVGYVFHIILTFPVIHFSMRQSVSELAFRRPSPIGKKKLWLLTAVLLSLIYVGSVAIPDIWVAFRFTGATTAISLGFIFPALIALRLDYHGHLLKPREKTVSWFVLVLAVVAAVVGVVGNAYSTQRRAA